MIRQSGHLPDVARMEKYQTQMAHLKTVEDERAKYNELVADSKSVPRGEGIIRLGPHPPNQLQSRMHYSFDYAQQVHLPYSPLQPGPIYFLVPRKFGIFGVCAEAFPQQVNYLIDEGMASSKGSNMVISLIHHFFLIMV